MDKAASRIRLLQNEYNCIANVLVLHIKEATFGVGEGWDSKKINEKRG